MLYLNVVDVNVV